MEKVRFEIAIENRHKGLRIDKRKVRRTVGIILAAIGASSKELSIIFIDDEEMRGLNRDYRKKDSPTDVLSFPMREGEFGYINPDLIGDVAISLDTAKRQAEERGKTTEDEIDFLLIHGILHLIGFDHEGTASEARRMNAMEKELMGLLRP